MRIEKRGDFNMATITLNGNILVGTLGVGSFANIGNSFTNTRNSTDSLVSKLGNLKSKVDVVCSMVNVETSVQKTAQIKQREEIKKSALTVAYDKLNTLITDVKHIDNVVSAVIEELKSDFYDKYNYLKPESETEKSWWESTKEKLWNSICNFGNAILNIANNVINWCKKHWKLIVTVVIVIVAVVLICTGVGGPLGAAAIGALIGAGAGGIFGGIMSAASGSSFWEGVENGAFSGAIAGTITGAMGFGFVGSSGVSLSFGQTVLTGGISSGGASLLSDLGDKFIKGENISFKDIFINTLFSVGTGAALSAVSYGAGKIVTSIKQKIFPAKNIQNAPYIKNGKPNGRPSPTGKSKEKFIENLYKQQVGKDGILRDPHTGEIIPWKPGDPMKNIVDIGHKTGKEYTKVFAKYQQGQWSLDKLKAFQSNPKNFYLEIARNNRSHKFEGFSFWEFIKGKNFPWISSLSGVINRGQI